MFIFVWQNLSLLILQECFLLSASETGCQLRCHVHMCACVVSECVKIRWRQKENDKTKNIVTMKNINYQTKTFSSSMCKCVPCNFRQSSRLILMTTWVLLERSLKAVNRQQEAYALHQWLTDFVLLPLFSSTGRH